MRLYSYVITRDYGFAPNPFFGVCTLATCKPHLRASADRGDWIVGIGSVQRGLGGRMIFAMEVSKTMSFNEYWNDERFFRKRPYLPGSIKSRHGDNIYHTGPNGDWIQENSHHSLEGGLRNDENVRRDTSTDRVLAGKEFYYFGRECPEFPPEFAEIGHSVRDFRCNFPEALTHSFVQWIRATYHPGIHGLPIDW